MASSDMEIPGQSVVPYVEAGKPLLSEVNKDKTVNDRGNLYVPHPKDQQDEEGFENKNGVSCDYGVESRKIDEQAQDDSASLIALTKDGCISFRPLKSTENPIDVNKELPTKNIGKFLEIGEPRNKYSPPKPIVQLPILTTKNNTVHGEEGGNADRTYQEDHQDISLKNETKCGEEQMEHPKKSSLDQDPKVVKQTGLSMMNREISEQEDGNLHVDGAEGQKTGLDVLMHAQAEAKLDNEDDFKINVEKLHKNLTMNKDYTEEFLDKGGYGSCWKRMYTDMTDGQTVVIKLWKCEKSELERYEQELEFATKHPHNNIVQVLAYFIQPLGDEILVWLLMEDGGNALFKRNSRQSFKPDDLAKNYTSIMRGWLEAVGHIHRNGFLYLDAKPQNILAHKRGGRYDVKLCDMGSIVKIGAPGQTLTTTPKYKPPDVLSSEPKDLTTKADVFSLGLGFYYILTGEHPWPNFKTVYDINDALNNLPDEGLFKCMCPRVIGCDTPPYKLLRRMVAKSPDDRPTVDECLRELGKMEAPYAYHADHDLSPLPRQTEVLKENREEQLPVVVDEMNSAEEEEQLPIVVDEMSSAEEDEERPIVVDETNSVEENDATRVPQQATSGVFSCSEI